MNKKILALALVGAALLSGCASVPKDAGQNPDDPWESLNRQTFAFNQGLDFILIRPLAKGYQFITPKPVREGVTRVFQNTMEPSNAVNNVLQGKVEEGILSLFRLMINSTVGVVGIFDVAQMVDIPRMPEDFGQTLATWGVPKGPYFVIPVLGPSTVRDTVGLVPEIFLDPNTYVGKDWFVWPWWGAKFVNARERLLPVTDMLDKTVDPYVATRNAYLQQRQNSLQDGDGPAMIQQPLLSPFSDEDSDNADKTTEVQKLNLKKSNMHTSRSSEIELQEVQNLNHQKYKKQTSRGSESELAEVHKADSIYTNYNQTNQSYTDISYTNPINQSGNESKSEKRIDLMDDVNAYIELIKDNIEYEHHMKYDDWQNKALYEELFEVICEVVCVKRTTIRIAGEDYPYELVKSKFLKLNSGHLEYVIGCMHDTNTKITNIKAYMVTTLYNAPSTMNHYYQQEVQHDMYGGGWHEKGIV